MGRRTALVMCAVSMTFAGIGPGIAGAVTPQGVDQSGTTTCTVTGTLRFSPALKGLNGGTSHARMSATLSRCTSTAPGTVRITAGRLGGFVGSVSPANCTSVALDHSPPPLAGGWVRWRPSAKANRSSAMSFPAGVAAIVTVNGVTFLEVSYAGGSVGSGSYANSGGSSLTVTSALDDSQIESRCVGSQGLSAVPFSGTITV